MGWSSLGRGPTATHDTHSVELMSGAMPPAPGKFHSLTVTLLALGDSRVTTAPKSWAMLAATADRGAAERRGERQQELAGGARRVGGEARLGERGGVRLGLVDDPQVGADAADGLVDRQLPGARRVLGRAAAPSRYTSSAVLAAGSKPDDGEPVGGDGRTWLPASSE